MRIYLTLLALLPLCFGQLYVVQQAGKYGVVDRFGTTRLPCVHDSLRITGERIISVKANRQILYDFDGNFIASSSLKFGDFVSGWGTAVKIKSGLQTCDEWFVVTPKRYIDRLSPADSLIAIDEAKYIRYRNDSRSLWHYADQTSQVLRSDQKIENGRLIEKGFINKIYLNNSWQIIPLGEFTLSDNMITGKASKNFVVYRIADTSLVKIAQSPSAFEIGNQTFPLWQNKKGELKLYDLISDSIYLAHTLRQINPVNWFPSAIVAGQESYQLILTGPRHFFHYTGMDSIVFASKNYCIVSDGAGMKLIKIISPSQYQVVRDIYHYKRLDDDYLLIYNSIEDYLRGNSVLLDDELKVLFPEQ